jgi:hypothetical protein
MVMIAEQYDYVIGGDPDRDTVDLAVLETGTGRVGAQLADAADGAGYHRMLTWAGENAPGRRIWALEGTGSFAAGLVVFLLAAGESVVEVGALKRARGAKNDRIDAVRAARQALARDEQGAPRAGGLREALRMVFACRQGVLVSRTKAINELKEPDRRRTRTATRRTAWPLPERPARTHRANAGAEHSTRRTASIGAHPSVNRGEDPVLVQAARRARSAAARLDQATPGRTGAARGGWGRTSRRRAAVDQLVSPRSGPQRGCIRILGRCRAAGSQQRPTLTAPAQPRRRSRTEPSPPHGGHHPHAMPPRDPRLREPTQRPRQDTPRHSALGQTRTRPTPLPHNRDSSPAPRHRRR